MTAIASRGRIRAGTRVRISGARLRRWSIGAAAILAALIVWQLLTTTGAINKNYISTPTDVVSAFGTMISNGQLWSNGRSSLVAFAVGFGISIAIGVPLGMAMGWNKLIRQFVQPPIMALFVTPRLALLPVIVVWLGIGTKSTVVVVVIGATIPIIVNAMAGVRDVDPKLLQVAYSFQASSFDLFRKILLPSAMPLILSGIRLAVGSAVLGVVVSEMYVSTGGVGNLITNYGQLYNTPYVVCLVLVVATFGWLVTSLVQMVENRFDRWRQR
jgi:ABC-type nitrate/sulfonate/bicarbonate transport system permease component